MIEIEEGENFTLKCKRTIPDQEKFEITGKIYLNVNGEAVLTNAIWTPIPVKTNADNKGIKSQ
jgi:hypothetical protein